MTTLRATPLERALAHWRGGQPTRAMPILANLLRERPDDPELMYYCGLMAATLGNRELGTGLLREATLRNPDGAQGWYNLGVTLQTQAELAEAAYAFAQCLRLKPRHVLAAANLAAIHCRLGDPAGATQLHDRALEQQWGDPDDRFAQALIYFLRGDYARGWQEYEWRWRCLQFQIEQGRDRIGVWTPPHRWDGRDLKGEQILVWSEQGLGDAIMGFRYVGAVLAMGGRVTLEAHHQLALLARANYGDCCTVITRKDDIPRDIEWHVPLFSVPAVLGQGLPDYGCAYLRPPTDGPALPDAGGQVRVGLVWAGNKDHLNDFDRSTTFATFLPLLEVPGVQFYSFQIEADRARELEAAPWTKRPIDCRGLMGDVADSAALLGQLDLLISVDTAPAHLAGALGQRVWNLVPTAPEWRWGLGDTTPWYSSMRLYRRRHWREWAPMIEQVRADLQRFVEERAEPRA